MLRNFQRFQFSRILATILIANFLCLVVLNLFEMKVYNTVFVYLFSVLVIYHIVQAIQFRKVPITIDNCCLTFVFSVLLLLLLSRLTYLTDLIPKNTVLVIGDDYARLAELISMTKSESYPIKHPSNQTYLLSFYYTSLFPLAVVKLLFPILSLKNVIALGNFFYQGLFLLSLFEVSHCLLSNYIERRLLIFFCTLFGGFEWLTSPTLFWGHFEWWQELSFHGNTQISSFFSGLFWTFHHFIAFYACVLMFVFLFYTIKKSNHTKIVLVLLLAASAFYSSPFGVISVPLFILIHRRVVWNKICCSRVFPFFIIMLLIPAFIFVGKLPSQRFVMSTFHVAFTGNCIYDKILSIPIFFFIVPIIEFAGIPLLLLLMWNKLSRISRQYLLASLSFLFLTYVIAFSGDNNLCMRGMFLPSFVFFILFSKHYAIAFIWSKENKLFKYFSPRPIIWILACILSIGTLKEFTTQLLYALENTRVVYTLMGKQPPSRLTTMVYQLARDSTQNTIAIPHGQDFDINEWKYNLEHLFDHEEITNMAFWEKELIRMPRKGVFY